MGSYHKLLLHMLCAKLELGHIKDTLLQRVLHLLLLLLSGQQLQLTIPLFTRRMEGTVQQQGNDDQAQQEDHC